MGRMLLIEDKETAVDLEIINKSTEAALRSLICKQSKGNFNQSYLFPIFNAVMSSNDKKLTRLLYLFYETIITEPCFIMCINQINKDLGSPNEYVRGMALKLSSKVTSIDHVNFSVVRDNLYHSNYYVRLNAVNCITSLALRFDLDVESDLLTLLGNEKNPKVLQSTFIALHQLCINVEDIITENLLLSKKGTEIDLILSKYNYTSDVVHYIIKYTDSIELLYRLFESKNDEIAFLSMLKLSNLSQPLINLQRIILILKRKPQYKKDFIYCIPRLSDSDYLKLLDLIDPFDLEFSKAVINTSLIHVSPVNSTTVGEILYKKYKDVNFSSDERADFKYLIIEKIAELVKSHFISIPQLIEDSISIVQEKRSEPKVLFYHLKLLKEVNNISKDLKITSALIDSFEQIKHGKILRQIFEVISLNIDKDNFIRLINKIVECINEKDYPFLTNEFQVFSGTHISLILASLYDESKFGKSCKALLISMILKFIEYGKSSLLMDTSSHSTILTILRSLLNNSCSYNSYTSSDNGAILDSTQPLDILSFDILKSPIVHKSFTWDEVVNNPKKTIQLTGTDDPLYVECNVTVSKYDVFLDFLVINQTDYVFQNIEVELSYSKELSLLSNSTCPISVGGDSAVTFINQFSIENSADCFITGTVYFKYVDGNRKVNYYSLNLSEVKLKIQDSLFPAPKNVDFGKAWAEYPWENLYCARIDLVDMDAVLSSLINSLNASLCDCQKDDKFLVANFACHTIKNDLICVNVCMVKGSKVELRIRASSEPLVLSTSKILRSVLIKE